MRLPGRPGTSTFSEEPIDHRLPAFERTPLRHGGFVLGAFKGVHLG